jgi:hypothetical protein
MDAARLPGSGNCTSTTWSSLGAPAAPRMGGRGLMQRVDGASAACLRTRICRPCAGSADVLAPAGENERRAEAVLLQG